MILQLKSIILIIDANPKLHPSKFIPKNYSGLFEKLKPTLTRFVHSIGFYKIDL